MPSILHFDIGAEDPEGLARFYEEVFGWKVEKWDGEFPYWMLITHEEGEPGIDGGIGKRQGPQSTVTNIVGVEDLDGCAEKVEKAGGRIVVPKQTIQGVGYLIICADPEGIAFGIMKSDMEAK